MTVRVKHGIWLCNLFNVDRRPMFWEPKIISRIKTPTRINIHSRTQDQVRPTYIVHMHRVNFHWTQTIFSCLAEGRTSCRPRHHLCDVTKACECSSQHNRESGLRWWTDKVLAVLSLSRTSDVLIHSSFLFQRLHDAARAV